MKLDLPISQLFRKYFSVKSNQPNFPTQCEFLCNENINEFLHCLSTLSCML